ncbi:hypothetical protein [Methylobacterium oryzisoli]|uniref:hypothetical protein n=1 Tax=Methylobacterium oryzisoli TaxID=3385502 RepID=UPI0038927644
MISFDLSAFEAAARQMDVAPDQVAFAISRTLNMAAVATENRLATETWPSHVTVRNRGFLKAALKPEFSTKRNLRVALVDRLGRGHLKLHAKGGTKLARGQFAIPSRNVTRTARGVRQNQKPANLPRKVVKGGLIFQARGKGKNQRLALMYKMQGATQQPADVPFYRDWQRFMRQEVQRAFPRAVAEAMRTRRR